MYDDLLREAEDHPVSGWDFSWLGSRVSTASPRWNFRSLVLELSQQSSSLLDLGTGGGEWLSELSPRPANTLATESWPANIPVAAARLRPLGIEVVAVESAPDNNRQLSPSDTVARLPFEDSSLDLVLSRHESFVASEVSRVLKPGGHFVTEQVGDGVNREFHELLELPVEEVTPISLSLLTSQLEEAGLSVTESDQQDIRVDFQDVGALAWYLRMTPWTVPTFSITDQREVLAALHVRASTQGSLVAHLHYCYLVATKPAATSERESIIR